MLPEIDESQAPVIIVRWPRQIALDELTAHFDAVTEVALRCERAVLVIDMSHAPVPSAKERAEASKAMQRAYERAGRRIAGVAHVVPSLPMRGALTALQWLAPPPFETGVFASRDEAIAWAHQRLRPA